MCKKKTEMPRKWKLFTRTKRYLQKLCSRPSAENLRVRKT